MRKKRISDNTKEKENQPFIIVYINIISFNEINHQKVSITAYSHPLMFK